MEKRKSLIVGVFRPPDKTFFSLGYRRAPWRDEPRRVKQIVRELPTGSKVVVDLTPDELEHVKNSKEFRSEDPIETAARFALDAGHEIVTSADPKTQQRLKKLFDQSQNLTARERRDLNMFYRLGIYSKIALRYAHLADKVAVLRRVRELEILEKIRQHEPAAIFVDEQHARRLREDDPFSHEFSLSPHREIESLAMPSDAWIEKRIRRLASRSKIRS